MSLSEPTPLSSPLSSARPPLDALDRLSRLVEQERQRLAAVARQEGLSPEEAVDCVQDALSTLLDLIQTGQVEGDGEHGPVLVTILRNRARNQRRRHHRSKPHVAMDCDELYGDQRPLPDELLARAEETVRLRSCVAQLCEIQRAVITLRLLEERPGEDVAELLGVSKNHVAVLLYRAKSALRDCLTG